MRPPTYGGGVEECSSRGGDADRLDGGSVGELRHPADPADPADRMQQHGAHLHVQSERAVLVDLPVHPILLTAAH